MLPKKKNNNNSNHEDSNNLKIHLAKISNMCVVKLMTVKIYSKCSKSEDDSTSVDNESDHVKAD